MNKTHKLLFPEWQGYSSHQDVYHGAYGFCKNVVPEWDFNEIEVTEKEDLQLEDKIIGKSSLIKMLSSASRELERNDPQSTFMIGGTCASEIVPVSFLNSKYDNDLAVFWFDAHGDLNTPESSPSNRLHGMPLRSLLGEGDKDILNLIKRSLAPDQVALVGVRDLDIGEEQFVKANELPIFSPDISSHVTELVDFAKERGFTKAYVHFDLDGLDPEDFPHVLMPVENGILMKQAIEAVKIIRSQLEVVGSSIVEFCPKNDTGYGKLAALIVDGFGYKL